MRKERRGGEVLKYYSAYGCLNSAAHVRLAFPKAIEHFIPMVKADDDAHTEDAVIANEKDIEQNVPTGLNTSELHALARQITGESHSSRDSNVDKDDVLNSPAILAYDKAPWSVPFHLLCKVVYIKVTLDTGI